jgi:hypothetical protein
VGDAVAPEIAATDYHTAGEPFRIVTAGVTPLAGAIERERRERAAASEPAPASADPVRMSIPTVAMGPVGASSQEVIACAA